MLERERRRHVRLKPTPELPVRVALGADGPLREALDVVDISVGGFSLSSPALQGTKAAQQMKLHVILGEKDEYELTVVVRWAARDAIGVELVDPDPIAAKAIARYVAELLERGGS